MIKKTKVLTRKEREKQRHYWREKQREHRSGRSTQKHRRVKEKDRLYRQNCKSDNNQVSHDQQIKLLSTEPTTEENLSTALETWTPAARRKAISRINRKLPRCRNKFAEAVTAILAKTTPKKREALRKKGIRLSPRKLGFEGKFSGEIVKNIVKRNPKVKKDIVKHLRELACMKKTGSCPRQALILVFAMHRLVPYMLMLGK